MSGFLMEWEEGLGSTKCISCFAVSAALSIATSLGVFLLRKHAGGKVTPRPEEHAVEELPDRTCMPDLAWVGWVAGGAGIMLFWMIQRVFPKEATELGWADSIKGTVLFVLCISQALVSLALRRNRVWMYDWRRICALGVCGIAGLVVLGIGRTPVAYCVGAALFGVYSGSFFFYLVFHALSHPEKSARYVAMNESVVGAVGIAGPMLGGVLADYGGFHLTYLVGAGVVIMALVFQAAVHRRAVPRMEGIA